MPPIASPHWKSMTMQGDRTGIGTTCEQPSSLTSMINLGLFGFDTPTDINNSDDIITLDDEDVNSKKGSGLNVERLEIIELTDSESDSESPLDPVSGEKDGDISLRDFLSDSEDGEGENISSGISTHSLLRNPDVLDCVSLFDKCGNVELLRHVRYARAKRKLISDLQKQGRPSAYLTANGISDPVDKLHSSVTPVNLNQGNYQTTHNSVNGIAGNAAKAFVPADRLVRHASAPHTSNNYCHTPTIILPSPNPSERSQSKTDRGNQSITAERSQSRNAQSEVTSNLCYHCGHIFTIQESRDVHGKDHLATTGIKCPKCFSRIFFFEYSDTDRFKCAHCGDIFPTLEPELILAHCKNHVRTSGNTGSQTSVTRGVGNTDTTFVPGMQAIGNAAKSQSKTVHGSLSTITYGGQSKTAQSKDDLATCGGIKRPHTSVNEGDTDTPFVPDKRCVRIAPAPHTSTNHWPTHIVNIIKLPSNPSQRSQSKTTGGKIKSKFAYNSQSKTLGRRSINTEPKDQSSISSNSSPISQRQTADGNQTKAGEESESTIIAEDSPSTTVGRQSKNTDTSSTCNYCGDSFPTVESLEAHRENHLTDGGFKCTKCNEECRTKVSLARHIKVMCGKGRSHICPYCDKGFVFLTHLRKHLRKIQSCANKKLEAEQSQDK